MIRGDEGDSYGWRDRDVGEDGDMEVGGLTCRSKTRWMSMGLQQETERTQRSYQIQGLIGRTRFFAKTWNWFQQRWDFCTSHVIQDTLQLTCVLCSPQSKAMTIRCQKRLSTWTTQRNYLHGTTSQIRWRIWTILSTHPLIDCPRAGPGTSLDLGQQVRSRVGPGPDLDLD